MIALAVGTLGITLSGAPTVGLALAIGSALYIGYERRKDALAAGADLYVDEDTGPGYTRGALLTMRAILLASSPTRSRLAVVLLMAISRRRSRAVG